MRGWGGGVCYPMPGITPTTPVNRLCIMVDTMVTYTSGIHVRIKGAMFSAYIYMHDCDWSDPLGNLRPDL